MQRVQGLGVVRCDTFVWPMGFSISCAECILCSSFIGALRVQGPKYLGFRAQIPLIEKCLGLKPHYLGPWTFRVGDIGCSVEPFGIERIQGSSTGLLYTDLNT